MKRVIAIFALLLSGLLHAGDVRIPDLPVGSMASSNANDSVPYNDGVSNVTRRFLLSDLLNVPSLSNWYAPINNPTFTGAVHATSFVGALTGNASTATALVADPDDCASNNYAVGIDSSANLSCLPFPDFTQYVKVDGTRPLTGNWNAGSFNITASGFLGNASTATALSSTSGVTAGSYTNASITVDPHGIVTGASSGLPGGITALTADVTASGSGSVAATVAKIQGTTVSGTTGTGNVVFSASPTLTGTETVPTVTAPSGGSGVAGTALLLSGGNGNSATGTKSVCSLGGGTSAGIGGEADLKGGNGPTGKSGGAVSLQAGAGNASTQQLNGLGPNSSALFNPGDGGNGGGSVIIAGGQGLSGSSANGGGVEFDAGQGDTGASGGEIDLNSGYGSGGDTAGASLSVTGGDNGDTSGTGGGIYLNAGTSPGVAGSGGEVVLESGSQSGAAVASVTLFGQSSSGDGSTIALQAGNAVGTNKHGGSVTIASGESTGSQSSNIQFSVAAPGASGTSLNATSTALALNYYGASFGVNVLVGAGMFDQGYMYRTTTGNFTISSNVWHVIVKAGSQSTVTITMPTTPIVDGQIVKILFVDAITTLTISPNTSESIVGTISTAAANSFASWIWKASTSTWYREG